MSPLLTLWTILVIAELIRKTLRARLASSVTIRHAKVDRVRTITEIRTCASIRCIDVRSQCWFDMVDSICCPFAWQMPKNRPRVSLTVTCVWREKDKCFGGRPPDCGDALQELSCVNEATNTTHYCEDRCEGDKWKACSQTSTRADFVSSWLASQHTRFALER